MKGVTKGWTKTLSVTRWLLALALIGGCHAVTPPATDKPRVVVIANTVAEADGLMAVLNSSEVRPEHLGAPKPASEYPRAPSTKPPEGLRGFYEGNGIRVEFWCVWELPGAKASIDGTPYKVKELPNVTQPGGKAPAMVIAFGTAAGHWETSHNGVVVVGSAVLFHSLPSLEDKDVTEALQRRGAVADQIIESPRGAAFLSKVLAGSFGEKRSEIEAKFLKPPLNPAFDPIVLLSPNRLGLASINVIKGEDYGRADKETLDAALAAIKNKPTFEVGGVETTHALIRASTPNDVPFIYVTAITNKLGWFPIELLPRRAAQHVATVNNAGVVAAYLVNWILGEPGKPSLLSP